ncbi:hypothetical protein K432DRAFT_318583 [Lepidopterella palustris CBS 459.81]|uniref:Protein transport protein sec16 n=1 Tax=Lepidopterella palustris CBS 459.81 TaxID=1314670 RepID=A0A8E2JK08_9PEZI|nr:hypothetical protein K432DRAFT_318583 [Lepidopterella palustris CBS 459.81]
MGSECGGPDFSYAYGGTVPAPETSWNPALQSDSDKSEQSASPLQNHQSPLAAVQGQGTLHQAIEDAYDLPVEPSKWKVASDRITDFGTEPASDDDFFDRYGSPNPISPVNPLSQSDLVLGSEEAPVEHSSAIVEKSAQLGDGSHIGPGATNGIHTDITSHSTSLRQEQGALDVQSEEHPPAESYEHQGKTTFLEEATHENEKVPLVGDAEAASIDWGSSGEVFDLGGKEQDGPLYANQTERGRSSTVESHVQEKTEEEPSAPEIDWGTSENVDFDFGTGAAQIPQSTKIEQQTQEHQDPVWDLDLDDDFLPDTDESTGAVLLEEVPSQTSQGVSQIAQPGSNSTNKYAPTAAQIQKPATNAYGVQAPQFTDFSQLDRSKPNQNSPVSYGAYNQSLPHQQQINRPPMPGSTQSFVDKSKGGYHSPYDLPDDIVKQRRRPAPHHVTVPTAQPIAPPPRSSSMYSNASAGAPNLPPPSNMSVSSLSPPSSSHSRQSPLGGFPGATVQQQPPAKSSSNEFFAELPIVSKPRHHAPPSGRYIPQNTMPTPPPSSHPPPHLPPNHRTESWSSQPQEASLYTAPLIAQLQAPEKLPPFPDLARAPSPTRTNSLPIPSPAPPTARYSPAPPSAPAAISRYSPAPPTASAPGPRYSPVPPTQAPSGPLHNRYASEPAGPPKSQPFAPRTSSPLAFHTLPQEQSEQLPRAVPTESSPPEFTHQTMHSVDGVPRLPLRHPLEEVKEQEELEQGFSEHARPSAPPMAARSATPPSRSGPSSTVGSPRKSSRPNYTPQYQSGPPPSMSNFAPPKRSQSQSPGTTMKNPILAMTSIERPASVHDPISPTSGLAGQSIASIIPHRRAFSRDLEYIAPTDERAADPLGRWKGYPIFKWGLGGTVITSFPKHIPRYGAGNSTPMMKCSPGEVKIQSIKEAFPLTEEVTKFPGPLKAKNKKKDVSNWLARKIEALEHDLKSPALELTMTPEDLKRLEEKILLWKVMQIFVDHDGHLEGNPAANLAVRKVLSPESLQSSPDPSGSFATGADLVDLSRTSTSNAQADPVDPRAVDELRNLLTQGEREKAVWHAVDQRLWAHAMLLSSTLDKNIRKQVVQEFVRKEVKKLGGNTQALAVLYEIFAGNWEDCVDELVPASARAGFQMISTDGNGSRENVLQGLDRWRETLLLILSNRSEGDVQALVSLGKLLAGYGRVEAAHICFIFARSAAYLGGADDPQSDIVLLGFNHRVNALDIGRDLEPILLTEIYEFGLSLSSPNSSTAIPHLQNYKLAHAYTLAEYGYRNEAQQYCDAIAAAIKSSTRVSPYYNGSFISILDDLAKRLLQSPKDGSSSWISKPSMEKVSGTLFAKLNSFIAGDDSDGASNHSGNGGANEVGPFAKIAGNTPTISPSHSSADLYGSFGSYPGSAPSTANTAPSARSKYAPGGAYGTRSSLDQARPNFNAPGQSPYQPSRPSMESADGSIGLRRGSDNVTTSPRTSGPYTPSQYSPPNIRAPAQRSQSLYSPSGPEASVSHSAYGNPYLPTPPSEEQAANSGYQPPQSSFDQPPALPPSALDESSGGYEPPSMGYEPPTSSYEPPSYQPYSPDDAENTSPVLEKKKSFMDDDEDDDIAQRAAQLKSKQKSEADRQADEAFRKAAEADAAKDKDGSSEKKGWFGGWFKRDPNASPAPIKAKLGEENSFVYDSDLGKWVNKKAGASSMPIPAPTPPPPKSGPPSRSVSGNNVTANHALGQLGSSLPHSMSMPPSRPPTSNPQRSSSMPPPMALGSRAATPSRSGTPGLESDQPAPTLMPPNLPPSGPPSRPSTGMSNASSIEDLIGAPQARKGGTVKKSKKGGRYIDVMAQK